MSVIYFGGGQDFYPDIRWDTAIQWFEWLNYQTGFIVVSNTGASGYQRQQNEMVKNGEKNAMRCDMMLRARLDACTLL